MPPSEGLPLSLDGIAIDTSIRIDSSGTQKTINNKPPTP
jgi:hypothetical protein